MSFRCGICLQSSEPTERAVTVVTITREREYRGRQSAHAYRRGNTTLYNDDPGGKGHEIVQEVKAHRACATEFEARSTSNQLAEALVGLKKKVRGAQA